MLNPLIDVHTLGANTAGIMHINLIGMTEDMCRAAEMRRRAAAVGEDG